ncbi:MAG: hypothetical protein ABIP75_11150 [Pyrinomonadaceae bacterium]
MNELSKSELTSISLLVDNYLRRPGSPAEANSGQHFDEDALSAFVEGALSEKESVPMVKHLVGCGLCRRFTAELSALRVELGEIDENQTVAPPEPSNIRQFLAALAERIGLTAEDDAVFAYHLPAEDFRPKEDAEKPDGDEKE